MKKDISFNPNLFLQGIEHFCKVSHIINGINHSIGYHNQKDVNPYEIDGFPILFTDKQGNKSATSEVLLQWLFKKGIEEIISGLFQSLKHAHTFVHLNALGIISQTADFSEEELDKKIEDIYRKPYGRGFPELINDIGIHQVVPLIYKDEILSINKLRNCIVHRNGIVTKSDANNSDKNALVIKYRSLGAALDKDGIVIPITKEVKKNMPAGRLILIPDIEKELIIPIGNEVFLDACTFNAILYTSTNFVNELIHRMPISEEIKSQLILPYTISN